MKRETSENLPKKASTGACSVAIRTTYTLTGAAPAENTHEGMPSPFSFQGVIYNAFAKA